MTPLFRSPAPLAVYVAAGAGLLLTAGPAAAGWNNVFQVCCHDCRPRARTSYAVSDPCPQPERRVEYRRSYYYEPVTVMRPERYTEEVPTQVRSSYYEPVTSYTYTSYYDPCTCQCQQIAVPRTSYVRREQCNTVMRYVERIRMVPTQVQRRVEVSQPVVTTYYPETRRYVQDCELPPAGGAAPAVPQVEQFRQGSPSVVEDGRSGGITPQNLPVTPQASPMPGGTSRFRGAAPPARPVTGPVNARTTARAAPAAVRGEVVLSDQVTPRPGAKLVFVSAADTADRRYATADEFGGFDLRLPAGEWYVYLGNGDGKAMYHKKVSIAEADAREFKVVSR